MAAAFPDNNAMDLAEYPEIMETFWYDIEHGASVMEAFGDGDEDNNNNNNDNPLQNSDSE